MKAPRQLTFSKLVQVAVFSTMTSAVVLPAGAEIIGPWNVQAAPVSAALVGGGGGGWMNVANVAVTMNDAFSGTSIIDDGWANFSHGATVEVTFGGGVVVNTAGVDLVLFESRFSASSYDVSTDFDAFAAQLALPANAFSDTGVDKSYFWSTGGGQSFPADVWAAGFDLSSLGIPLGSSVDRVRFRTTSGEADPLGFGYVPTPGSMALLAAGGIISIRRRR